ncbi:aldehyde dehydrogenase family protein, partial [Streptococcus suis]
DQDLRYIKIGQDEGAKLAFGGELLKRDTPGHYLQPALFTEASNTMRIAREEIFGPVLATLTFRGVDEAVRIANSTIYGLAGSIWTRDIDVAIRASRAIRAGLVYVNNY